MFQHILINIPNLLVILKAIITWGFNISEELTNSLPQDLNLAPGSLWLTGRTEFPHQLLLHQTSCLPLIKRFNVIKYYKRKQMHISPSEKHLFIHWFLNLLIIWKTRLPKMFCFYLTRIYRTSVHAFLACWKKNEQESASAPDSRTCGNPLQTCSSYLKPGETD